MQIEIKNTIKIDDELELIREVYDCELIEKAGWHYLIYHNSEKEKVVIKIKDKEMVMTRFGQEQTNMRFIAEHYGAATIPTPMGLQKLLTQTQHFDFQAQEGKLTVHYDLLMSPEAERALASYELNLAWGEA